MENKKVLLIGGDKRFDYVRDYLLSHGFDAIKYDGDKNKFFGFADEENATVILPLPVSRNSLNINMTNAYPSVEISELVSHLKKGDTVFGGIVEDKLRILLEGKGVAVFDYYDEGMINANAVLTAEALNQVFSGNGLDFKHGKILVTGYGRTAKAIAQMLKAEKCDFCISARSRQAQSEAEKSGYAFVLLENFYSVLSEFNIIINTVPALILDEKALAEMTENTVIVDVASAPFGEDEKMCSEFSVKVIRALALPGKYTPVQAGVLIGERIESILSGGR